MKMREAHPLGYSLFMTTTRVGARDKAQGRSNPFLRHLRPWTWPSAWQRMYVAFGDCSPQCSGFSLCSQIRYTKHSPNVPQVVRNCENQPPLLQKSTSLPQPTQTFLQKQGKWLLTFSHLQTFYRNMDLYTANFSLPKIHHVSLVKARSKNPYRLEKQMLS